MHLQPLPLFGEAVAITRRHCASSGEEMVCAQPPIFRFTLASLLPSASHQQDREDVQIVAYSLLVEARLDPVLVYNRQSPTARSSSTYSCIR